MSAHEIYLGNQIGELKARERLLKRCCRDLEEEADRQRTEIARLLKRRDAEGRTTAPPHPPGGQRAA